MANTLLVAFGLGPVGNTLIPTTVTTTIADKQNYTVPPGSVTSLLEFLWVILPVIQ